MLARGVHLPAGVALDAGEIIGPRPTWKPMLHQVALSGAALCTDYRQKRWADPFPRRRSARVRP